MKDGTRMDLESRNGVFILSGSLLEERGSKKGRKSEVGVSTSVVSTDRAESSLMKKSEVGVSMSVVSTDRAESSLKKKTVSIGDSLVETHEKVKGMQSSYPPGLIPLAQEEVGESAADERLDVQGQVESNIFPEEGFGEDDAEREETEVVAAKAAAIPVKPPPQMVRDHMVAHIPYRSWCPHCVRGRARLDQHRVVKEHEGENVAVVSMDYVFLAADAETLSAMEAPVLTIRDRLSTGIWRHPVQHKGVSEDTYGAESLVKGLDRLGHKRIHLKCDHEQAILSIAQHAKRTAKAEVIVERPPLGEARGKSNGEVEWANQTIQGLVRTYKSDLEANLKRELPSR